MRCKGLTFLFLVTSILFSLGQNKQLLFGFNDIPQSVLINPSTTLNNDWYAGFPLISHFHSNFGASGTSAYDLFADDGRDFNSKLRSVVFSLDSNDFFVLNQQLEIFSGGFSYGKGIEKDRYISFGMYQEADVIVYYPKDYAVLAYEGNASNIGRVFDLSDLNLSGEVLTVVHLGIAKKINSKLTIGARGKIYSSIFNINSTNNEGTFLTQQGQNNFLEHRFDLDLSVHTSGIKNFTEDDTTDFTEDDLKTIRNRALLGGNLGLGFDFGLTYNASEQLVFEASLLDIGFISHAKDLENYSVNGNYVYEGVNPIFPEVSDGQTAEDYWDEVADNFEDLFEVDTTAAKYTTWRPIKFNAALRYAFGEKISKDCNCLDDDIGYTHAIGGQLYVINRQKSPQLALTAYYYKRIIDGIRIKATYTVDSFSFTNVGLGVSTQLGPLNFYLLADNILEYQNLAKAQSVSLQLGFNLIFGGRSGG